MDSVTHEEQVLLDALKANGFEHVTLWSLKCLNAAMEPRHVTGPNWQRLVEDLRRGEEGVHAEALTLYKQAQCKHRRIHWAGRTAICSECQLRGVHGT